MTNIRSIVDFIYILAIHRDGELNEVLKSYLLFSYVCVCMCVCIFTIKIA